MDILSSEKDIGYRLQVGNKYFFIRSQLAAQVEEGSEPEVIRPYDRDDLVEQALFYNPGTRYFRMNRDFTAFIPDDEHTWSVLAW